MSRAAGTFWWRVGAETKVQAKPMKKISDHSGRYRSPARDLRKMSRGSESDSGAARPRTTMIVRPLAASSERTMAGARRIADEMVASADAVIELAEKMAADAAGFSALPAAPDKKVQ